MIAALPEDFNFADLMALDIPMPQWVVKGLLAQGISILAGRPKVKKSWLALGLAIAVASGGKALGSVPVDQGDVLYLALEDSLARLKDRGFKQLCGEPAPRRLEPRVTWPRGQQGVQQIEAWLLAHPDARLVVIDTFARFRAPRRERGYDEDYSDIAPLQTLAAKYRVAILIIHHVRKMDAEDWIDTISGTLGMAGAADGVMALVATRGEYEGTLKVTGRDIEELELGLEFSLDIWNWSLLGKAEETVAISKERKQILQVLAQTPLITPSAIAKRLDKSVNAIDKLLRRMVDDGLLFNDSGHYGRLSGGVSRVSPNTNGVSVSVSPTDSTDRTDSYDSTDLTDYFQ